MSIKDEDFIGTQTKERCPSCEKGLLFTNKVGNKWCSNTASCNYHVKANGERRMPPKDVELPFGSRR